MNTTKRVILVAVSLGTGCGCAYKPHALPIREVAEYSHATRIHDLALAAQPFGDTMSKGILNRHVNQQGFVPILLLMENKGSSRVPVYGGRIHMEDSQGRLLERVDAEQVAKKCEKSVGLHVFLFGWISGLGAANYNKRLLADWKEKEFPTQSILEPHSSVNGLLFCRTQNVNGLRGGRLILPIAEKADEEYKEVDCALPCSEARNASAGGRDDCAACAAGPRKSPRMLAFFFASANRNSHDCYVILRLLHDPVHSYQDSF